MLHVRRRVVEKELGRKVVKTWRFWIELEADKSERLASNLANGWVRFECSCRVLHDVVLHWGIARVVQLHGLVDTLIRTAVGEGNFSVAQLNHGDERLRTWCK